MGTSLMKYRPTAIEKRNSLLMFPEPIGRYEWFNNKNCAGALHALEAAAHASVNGINSQVELYKKEAVAMYNKDRSEKTVAIGERLGMKPKPKLFAVHELRENKPFEIKSPKWDWKIYPVDSSNQKVPLIFLQKTTFLSGHGIDFDSIAIAVPSKANYLPFGHVLKDKTKNTLAALVNFGAELGNLSYKIVKSAGPIGRAFLKDPVLLGCFGRNPMFMVEIGRWE